MIEPIRVLHVVTYMGRGGLETMLMNYYRHIDRDKIQFDFLVHRDFEADYDSEILSLGGKIYHLPKLNPLSLNYRKQLDSFFKQHKEYKIVHVHQDCLSAIVLKVAKKAEISVRIAHSHSSSQDKNVKYLIKLFYRQFIPKYATDLFACGREAGDWMFKEKNYHVVRNAISSKDYIYKSNIRMKIREDLNLKNDFTIGLVGRFSYPKNHDFLLDIFNELVNINPNSKLLLVGDGDLRLQIEEKINKLTLKDKVILTGVRTDISDLLQAMDVFVMPSLYEGLPLSIIEAQASGLPCFISDKVPIECKKTDLVTQISLSESPEYWAKQILHTKDIERRNTYEEIVESGFDIEENAKLLQEFYIRKVGD
ncbi:MAG: glycosyltransferase family 1 protein [Erysipelotrichaceae bacterium]|nr:glycosyltransferase family 1 protein [Erysipelotrichaceae bacterium]